MPEFMGKLALMTGPAKEEFAAGEKSYLGGVYAEARKSFEKAARKSPAARHPRHG